MASGALFHIVTNDRPNKPGEIKYACEIYQQRDSVSMHQTGADWVRQMVVHTAGDMSNVLVHGKPVQCQQVQPGWWIVPTDCIFTMMEPTVSGLPIPNRTWLNSEWWDMAEHMMRVQGNGHLVARSRPPERRVSLHAMKLQQAMGMHEITDVTWSGVPWNQSFCIKMHGIVRFEIQDPETRMAMEIMCGGTSTYHLGCTLFNRRIDWRSTVESSKQRCINGIQSKM
jgi:hypothetical protein